jgi:hypothetical protein
MGPPLLGLWKGAWGVGVPLLHQTFSQRALNGLRVRPRLKGIYKETADVVDSNPHI